MELLKVYEQMAMKIIAVQEAIIGPLAIQQAEGVEGLSIDKSTKEVSIIGDGKAFSEPRNTSWF
jgi:hypothetical protein